MTDARRGRAAQRYSLRRIRLLHFHNLVDEIIEIREGGHLFLLGDNGSGKTTVLDAIHLALTGAQHVELNAAARVAGGRDAGRSLQGVVLRYDAERGVRNEGGAIAYVLLELSRDGEDGVVSLGVGIEATTMDSDVSRWGIFRRGPLEELRLVEERPEGRVPVSRDVLRATLGKLELFPRMTEYRKVIAERLFGGDTLYDEVCRFWTMAKAYREIVSKARDFGTLFVRLLPAPDAQTFDDILRSLRALDDLEGLMDALERQRNYVAGLTALVMQIRVHREEIARYHWLVTFRRHAVLCVKKESVELALGDAERDVAQCAAEVARARGELRQTRQALVTATSSEAGTLLAELRHYEAELERDKGDAEAAAEALRDEQHRQQQQARRLEHQHAALVGLRERKANELQAAAEEARTLEHPLPLTLAAASAERQAATAPLDPLVSSPWTPLPGPAQVEVDAFAHAMQDALDLARSEQHRSREERDRRCEELALLQSDEEEFPNVPGFQSARRDLAQAGISATPLYELLQPRASALDESLAALEALLGDAALGTFVVAADGLDAGRPHILPHDGARVVVRTATDAVLPAWITDILSERSGSPALDVLATLLSQAPTLGDIRSPDALGDVEHRGALLRPRGVCRLIGAEARRRARRARLLQAEQELAASERALADSEARLAASTQALAAARGVGRALSALRELELSAKHAELETTRAVCGVMAEQVAKSTRVWEMAHSRNRDSEARVEALRTLARQTGAEAIERSLAALRAQEELAILREQQAGDAASAARSRQEGLTLERETLDAQLALLSDGLQAASTRLESALADLGQSLDGSSLERYVRVTQRGDQFTEIENIEERLRHADRQEAAAVSEMERDGSRGILNLEWAGSFGFAWSSADLRVTDRRGEPLSSVLARLENELGEQRAVVNEHTHELMNKLVMGDLARELQEQVERLYRTIREINELLAGLRFGNSRYQFKVTPHRHAQELVDLVRKQSILDQSSRARFREFIDERLTEVRQRGDHDEVPEVLDYRRWFDYRLSVSSGAVGDIELTRELRALGSGGEQGVPNYLLVLAMAKLMFDSARAKIRPLLFDEAFYGIDAGRRDQLLKFATELDIDLVVASPDQDGVTPSARRTTTLFLVKDEHGDVHLAPYHYWNDATVAQPSLFAERADEPNPDDALCTLGELPPP